MLVVSILFGILLIYILSETIFGKVNYVNWLLTLFIISAPIQLLTYTQAWIIKYYLFGISSLSLFLLLYKICKKEFSKHETLYLKINSIKAISLSNFKAFKLYDNFIQILVTLF